MTNFLILKFSPQSRKWLTHIGIYLGLFLVITKTVFPTYIGGFDNSVGFHAVEPPLIASMLEIILVVFFIYYTLRVKQNILERLAVALGILLFAGSIASFTYTFLSFEEKQAYWSDYEVTTASRSELPNIYHIVLDAYDGQIFPQVVNNSQSENGFNEFVWYKNAVANYTTTNLSVPSFMTGKIFLDNIKQNDISNLAATDGIISRLSKKGYIISQYNSSAISNHNVTNNRFSSRYVKKNLLTPETVKKAYRSKVIQLADLVALYISPSFLQTSLIIDQRGIFTTLLKSYDEPYEDWTRESAIISRDLLYKLLEDEKSRFKKGEYVFAHLLLPHSPWVLDKKCNYIARTIQAFGNLLEQTQCVTDKIRELIAIIKKNNNFDDSLIVIHSDHGEVNRKNPLLLIKFPKSSSHKYQVSDSNVQLLDVAPTILKYAGIEYKQLAGEPLFAAYRNPDREIHIIEGLSKAELLPHYSMVNGKEYKKYSPVTRVFSN